MLSCCLTDTEFQLHKVKCLEIDCAEIWIYLVILNGILTNVHLDLYFKIGNKPTNKCLEQITSLLHY